MDKSQKNEFERLLSRAMEALKVDNEVQLADILGYKSTGTISGWRAEKNIPEGGWSRISQKSKIPIDILKSDAPLVSFAVVENQTEFTLGTSHTQYITKVTRMMADMDEETQKDICLSVEKEKLLRDLLRQKESDEKAG